MAGARGKQVEVTCAHCAATWSVKASRAASAGPGITCSMACRDATKRVTVMCAVCPKQWTVKKSRAEQNANITCSDECFRTHASRVKVAAWGSEETRVAECDHCGTEFTRKPSQIAKYDGNYCGRDCKVGAMAGTSRPDLTTGAMFECDICDEAVWRSPSRLHGTVYCSKTCTAIGQAVPRGERGPYVERVAKPCGACEAMMLLLPCEATRTTYCSRRCAQATLGEARRGTTLSAEHRARMSEAIRAKWSSGEWEFRREYMSVLMSEDGNPMWEGGLNTKEYAPGFTDRLKRQIIERDQHMCRMCGTERDEVSGGYTHVVHHVDGGRTNHDPANLVLLCRPCHAVVHADLYAASAARRKARRETGA